MIRCFADTFFYLAFLNQNDEAHAQAVEFVRSQNAQMVTTAWVLTEVADALAKSRREWFRELLAAIQADGRSEIVPASQEVFDSGVQLYLSRPDKEWSLTDCISFVVMGDRGLGDALTGDHHFAQAGYRLLFV